MTKLDVVICQLLNNFVKNDQLPIKMFQNAIFGNTKRMGQSVVCVGLRKFKLLQIMLH